MLAVVLMLLIVCPNSLSEPLNLSMTDADSVGFILLLSICGCCSAEWRSWILMIYLILSAAVILKWGMLSCPVSALFGRVGGLLLYSDFEIAGHWGYDFLLPWNWYEVDVPFGWQGVKFPCVFNFSLNVISAFLYYGSLLCLKLFLWLAFSFYSRCTLCRVFIYKIIVADKKRRSIHAWVPIEIVFYIPLSSSQ